MKGDFEQLAKIRPDLPKGPEPKARCEDDFLRAEDLVPVRRQAAEHRLRMVLAELEDIGMQKQWQQAVDMFLPVEDQLPELVDYGLDLRVRERLAFALGQLGRFDDAMDQLTVCVARRPQRFQLHSALAYTAYNSLFAARNREIFLSGESRGERIELAHKHFVQAQQLRPEGVTNYYRQGMLFHRIEDKPDKALPLFELAVANWEALDGREQKRRHQERKNYVKSLYQSASILLAKGIAGVAEGALKRCMAMDEGSNYISRLYKYFALGKIEYCRNRYPQARDALLFAEKCRGNQNADFVFELLARVYLAMDSPDKALASIKKVPPKGRRAYFRWTEADVLCVLGRYDEAKSVLRAANEQDRRSRHKGLIRLCKIEYLLADYENCLAHAAEADRFFRKMWTNVSAEALFWQSLSAFRAGRGRQAKDFAEQLSQYRPDYPQLEKLLELIGGESNEGDDRASCGARHA